VLADSVRARIQIGQNIYDHAAAPLELGLPGCRPDGRSGRLRAVSSRHSSYPAVVIT